VPLIAPNVTLEMGRPGTAGGPPARGPGYAQGAGDGGCTSAVADPLRSFSLCRPSDPMGDGLK
jgi:hypothetical protein